MKIFSRVECRPNGFHAFTVCEGREYQKGPFATEREAHEAIAEFRAAVRQVALAAEKKALDALKTNDVGTLMEMGASVAIGFRFLPDGRFSFAAVVRGGGFYESEPFDSHITMLDAIEEVIGGCDQVVAQYDVTKLKRLSPEEFRLICQTKGVGHA